MHNYNVLGNEQKNLPNHGIRQASLKWDRVAIQLRA